MTIVRRPAKKGIRYGVRVTRAGGVQEWIGTFETRKEAKDAERKELSRSRRRKHETCDSFAERWVDDFPRPRGSTNNTNRNAVKKFAKDPRFSGLKLNDLDKVTAMEWARENPYRLAAIRNMFGDAVRLDLCERNPFAELRLPQSKGRKDLEVISQEELDDLCDSALKVHEGFGPAFRAMIIFAAYTLMRPGEIFVLEWSDLDLDPSDPTISVTKTLSGDGTIQRPKNGKTRTICLPPPALEALRDVPRTPGTQRIFSTSTGRRFSKSSFHYAWTPVRQDFGRPKMDFYELKHFGCTHYLDDLGMSASDVALQCGHTDGGILVMKIYGHPSASKSRDRTNAAWKARQPPPRLRVVG